MVIIDHLYLFKQKLKIMKKQFIVIEEGAGDYFIVDDLKELITEMYGKYNDKTEDSFYRIYKVIEIKGEFEITEMN